MNALIPEGRCEKVDSQLVRSIIGLKHRMGLGINWSSKLADELHKQSRSEKHTVFAKQVDDIWTADLHMSITVFQIEQGLQISPDCD